MTRLSLRLSIAKGLAAVGALAFAGAAIPAAAAPVSEPTRALPFFDAQYVGPLLDELGILWQTRQAPNGQTYIQAAAGGAMTFEVIPAACQEGGRVGCVGVNFLARFLGRTPNPQTVTAFNQKYAFTTAGTLPGQAGAYIGRYEIADFGMPRGNFAASLETFIYLAERFRNDVEGSRRTVERDGTPDDLAARYLNAREVRRMGVAYEAAGSDLAPALLHRADFEGEAAFVRLLNETTPDTANKIRNIAAD